MIKIFLSLWLKNHSLELMKLPRLAALRLNLVQLSVTDIASALRISHASVSQSRKSLEDAGYVVSRPAPDDAQRRLLELSESGVALTKRLTPLWEADARAAVKLGTEPSGLMDALDRRSFIERALTDLNDGKVPGSDKHHASATSFGRSP